MAIISIELTDTFDQWRIKSNSLGVNVGDITLLNTTDKDSCVDAINELEAETATIGLIASLTTTDKSSTVDAINEVNSLALTNEANIASHLLTLNSHGLRITTLEDEFGDLGAIDVNIVDKDNLVEAVNWIYTFANGISVGTGFENFLNYPTNDGDVLVSTIAGARSWETRATIDQLNLKADQADLDTTNGTITSLTGVVDTKADQTDLDNTDAAVATKAPQTELDALETLVDVRVPSPIDTIHVIGNAGSSLDLVSLSYDTFTFTCDQSTLTLTVADFPTGKTITVIPTMGGTGRSITWPTGTKWPEGTAPDLSDAGTYRVVMQKIDGTTIHASLAGALYA